MIQKNKSETFLEQALKIKNRMPGFIAAKRALIKGEEIAILTARSSKESHSVLLKRLEKSLGKKINSDDIHFVSDPGYSGSDTAEKKLNVLKRYSKKYDKVKFYDDEEKNLKIVEAAKILNLKAYDIKKFDANKLNPVFKNNGKVIHVFDLDGTVWRLPAFIKIKNSKGDIIKKISQEELAEGKYKLESGDELDFSDFSNPNKLKKDAKSKGIFNV